MTNADVPEITLVSRFAKVGSGCKRSTIRNMTNKEVKVLKSFLLQNKSDIQFWMNFCNGDVASEMIRAPYWLFLSMATAAEAHGYCRAVSNAWPNENISLKLPYCLKQKLVVKKSGLELMAGKKQRGINPLGCQILCMAVKNNVHVYGFNLQNFFPLQNTFFRCRAVL